MVRKRQKYKRTSPWLADYGLADTSVRSSVHPSAFQMVLTFALMTVLLFRIVGGSIFCPNMQPAGAGDDFATIVCSSNGAVTGTIDPSGNTSPQGCDWCSCCLTTIKFVLFFVIFGIAGFEYTASVYRNWSPVFVRLLVVLCPYAPRSPPVLEP